ncbi:MAG: ABC transporter permease [Planctomycetes bacterium]|nr:ABC transporter permease [Planctomycetota bacterium]
MNSVSSSSDAVSGVPPEQARSLTQTGFWLPIWTLASRELVRFFRQRTRMVGALGQPLIFWILFGAGLHGSFRNPAWVPSDRTMTYQEYFFPGVAVMIVMFTAIFSTISIIEDRKEGFLQGVLVAPISRLSLVLGKLCGGTALAVIQAGLFLLIGPMLAFVGLAPTIDLEVSALSAVAIILFLTLLSFTLTALGYVIAWPLDSTQGFHAIMSVFLMPMWLLSGAFFPAGDSGWLSWVIIMNPLTYGVAGLRRLMYPNIDFSGSNGLPGLGLCILITVLFCVVCVGLAVYLTQRRTSFDAR